MVACWPRLAPSALNVKAAVEQPVFVTPPPAASGPKALVTTAQPLGKEAIGKLATALRDQPPARQAGGPGATLAIPIDEARRLCAEGLVAFANGDIATARAFFMSAADAGDPRALVALGDTFDPATLTRLGVVGLKGDGAKARDYYARALAAGAGGARERIAALAAK
jgi:TPR repeat protein